MRPSRLAPLALAGALALGLSGCFANPVEQLVEGVVEQQTGVDVNTGGAGESASVPADWPGLPIPEGRIVSTLSVDGIFSLSVLVDSEEEIESVIAELIADGYAEVSRADLGGLDSVIVSSSEWTASFGWFPDEESGKFALNYGVAPTSS